MKKSIVSILFSLLFVFPCSGNSESAYKWDTKNTPAYEIQEYQMKYGLDVDMEYFLDYFEYLIDDAGIIIEGKEHMKVYGNDSFVIQMKNGAVLFLHENERGNIKFIQATISNYQNALYDLMPIFLLAYVTVCGDSLEEYEYNRMLDAFDAGKLYQDKVIEAGVDYSDDVVQITLVPFYFSID